MVPSGPVQGWHIAVSSSEVTPSQGHFPSAFYIFPASLTIPPPAKVSHLSLEMENKCSPVAKRKGWVSMATPFPNEGCSHLYHCLLLKTITPGPVRGKQEGMHHCTAFPCPA